VLLEAAGTKEVRLGALEDLSSASYLSAPYGRRRMINVVVQYFFAHTVEGSKFGRHGMMMCRTETIHTSGCTRFTMPPCHPQGRVVQVTSEESGRRVGLPDHLWKRGGNEVIDN
jgi:hypothetical protein